MPEYRLKVDGKDVTATEGMTLLEACRAAGIFIPTLCYHEDLKPHGGCRLCMVEAEGKGGKRLVAACVHPVEEDLVVQTRSPRIDRIRKTLVELLLARAPQAPILLELAEAYGADANRFDKDPSFCIHCGLCVRYCAEVKGKHVVGFIDRGTRKEISFIPELAAKECASCKACFPLCPTSYAQAAYVLTESLAFPPTG